MIEVAYKTRVFCPECNAAIWTDLSCGSAICPCGGAHIHNDVVQAGDPVTDEVAFKQQAADDLQVTVAEIEVIAL